ncbi:MAG: hypothetical protein AB8H86_32290 [Polyangiales bacterium]
MTIIRTAMLQPNRVGWYVLQATGRLLAAYSTFNIVRMERRPLEPRAAYEADPLAAMVASGGRWEPALHQCQRAWEKFDAKTEDAPSRQELARVFTNAAEVLEWESRVADDQ